METFVDSCLVVKPNGVPRGGVPPATSTQAGARAGVVGGPPCGRSPLPCLNRNNSDKSLKKHEVFNHEGDVVRLGGINGYERKIAFMIESNGTNLFLKNPLEKIGFLTVTFGENLVDFKEASRRINNFQRRVLPLIFPDNNWVQVKETQKRGAIHYHYLGVCSEDIRTGVDFEALAARNYKSAGKHLKGLWALLREKCPKYGLGRHELLPIHKSGEAMAKYVGKYINKCHMYRTSEFKGMRFVAFGKGFERSSSMRFTWSGYNYKDGKAIPTGGKKWRDTVGEVAEKIGATEIEGITKKLGKRWAWHLMEYINLTKVEDSFSGVTQVPGYELEINVDDFLKEQNERLLYQRWARMHTANNDK